MNEYVEGLFENRKVFLNELVRQLQSLIATAPPGTLNIGHCRNSTQYYMYMGRDKKPIYLSVKKTDLISSLAQKDYHMAVLDAAVRELEYIKKVEHHYPVARPEDLYEQLSDERKKLVSPVIRDMEEYAKEWQAQPFQSNPFHKDGLIYKTMRGDLVRSKSESLIADRLFSKQIPYKYEAPLKVSRNITYYPDFTILNKRTRKIYYHEHLGMIGDPDYARDAVIKLNNYEKNGFFHGETLITSCETCGIGIDMVLIDALIDKYYI